MTISDSIKYVGVNDNEIDLFEGQYPVPDGIAYNSYIIFDEKIALMDTVDITKFDEWNKILDSTLNGKTPDYLVIQHLEPDHAGSIEKLVQKYPNITLVGNAKTFAMLPQFFENLNTLNTVTVKEGDSLSLGIHNLTFVLAPMVHWPEVMLTYESTEKVLFSADAFGTFGSLPLGENFVDEARRYYINIVGKYGKSVQMLLKKAASLDISTICPLHGDVISKNLGEYLSLYNTWSSYQPETKGVFVAYASIYGNTKKAALMLVDELKALGITAHCADVARTNLSYCVANAFKFSHMVCAAPSYDGGVFLPMEDFLHHIKAKTYQNRTVALIENGSWGPIAARSMAKEFEAMQNIDMPFDTVTIKSAVKATDAEGIKALAKQIASSVE